MKVLLSFLLLCLLSTITGAKSPPKVGKYATNRSLIPGGSKAPEGEYPYQASIRRLFDHICGGAIVTSRWILTAASCFDGLKNCELKVAVGSQKLYCGKERLYNSDLLVQHPRYDFNTNANNIGLLRVSTDIEFNRFTKSIKLPCSDIKDYTHTVFSGWGSAWDGYIPNDLQHVPMRTSDRASCQKTAQTLSYDTNSYVCALNVWGRAICYGEAGSPLAADGVIVGISSFHLPCANNKPDVFVKVYSFLDWIYQELKLF